MSLRNLSTSDMAILRQSPSLGPTLCSPFQFPQDGQWRSPKEPRLRPNPRPGRLEVDTKEAARVWSARGQS